MRANSLFYATQIGLCTQRAAEAGLANQRDMHLRARAAWQTLADREAAAEADRARLKPPVAA